VNGDGLATAAGAAIAAVAVVLQSASYSRSAKCTDLKLTRRPARGSARRTTPRRSQTRTGDTRTRDMGRRCGRLAELVAASRPVPSGLGSSAGRRVVVRNPFCSKTDATTRRGRRCHITPIPAVRGAGADVCTAHIDAVSETTVACRNCDLGSGLAAGTLNGNRDLRRSLRMYPCGSGSDPAVLTSSRGCPLP